MCEMTTHVKFQCPYGQQLQSKYSHSSNLLREQQSNQQCSEYGKNKTPGPDGLHEEFTVHFLTQLLMTSVKITNISLVQS